MPRPSDSNRSGNRWAGRIIPCLIVCVFILATYAVVGRICVGYLYREKHKTAVATVLLVLYFLSLLLTASAYLRTFFTVQTNPGLVPLENPTSDIAERTPVNNSEKPQKAARRRRDRDRDRDRDIEARPYAAPDPNPDSPGLEAFYSKDVFACEVDGRPKWCSECRAWKPDRAHHSSEMGRCVRKMDHFCPWVGGMVSETSFNFFTQFTFYCALFCATSLAAGAYTMQLRHRDHAKFSGWPVAVVVVSAVFGSFSGGMFLTSLRYILTNITNIDMLRRSHTHYLAVRIPLQTPISDKYDTIIYPLQPWAPRPNILQHQHGVTGPQDVVSHRDQQAQRKFAILRTQPRENPWNLGLARNWRSVMGNNVLEWLLPIKHSPCCNHDSMDSDYDFGPLVEQLRTRYGVPDINMQDIGTLTTNRMEMQATSTARL